MSQNDNMPTRAAMPVLMNPASSATYLDLKTTNFKALVKAGRIPAPVYLTPRRPLWKKTDLDAFAASL